MHGTSFSLHPLIQDWMKLRLDPRARQDYTIEAIAILSRYIDKSGRLALRTKQTILSHLDSVLENDGIYLVQGPKLGELSLKAPTLTFASFCIDQGRYKEAERLYERALKGREEQLGPEHPDTLRTVEGLAIIYANQYQYAEPLYERALKGRGEEMKPGHPHTRRLGAIVELLHNNDTPSTPAT